jgi:hypothetical protein
VFIRLRRGLGESQSSMSSALGALDQIFSPGAARAREDLHALNQRVIATPSPGDELLDEGRVVIALPPA